jgi:hypothetical protein
MLESLFLMFVAIIVRLLTICSRLAAHPAKKVCLRSASFAWGHPAKQIGVGGLLVERANRRLSVRNFSACSSTTIDIQHKLLEVNI